MRQSKKYLVTGASSGLGEALCHYLLKRGDVVLGVARTESKLQELSSCYPDNFSYQVCDITQKEDVAGCIHNLAQKGWCPDVVLLNAGVNVAEKELPLDTDAMEVNFNTNLFGTLCWIKVFLDKKIWGKKLPHFVVISSVAVFRAKKAYISYSASKAALNFMIEGIQLRMGSRIRISKVLLGPVDTPMLRSFPQKVPIKMDPRNAAASIIKNIDRGRKNIYVPFSIVAITKLISLLPLSLYKRVMALVHDAE